MAITASANDFGIPVISGLFKKISFRAAAYANWKINTSAALTCAASSNQRDQMISATIEIYWRRLCANSL